MDYKKIRLSTADGVATLTLNDPSTLNAAGIDLSEEMAHALRSIAAGVVEARAVIITG